MPGDRRNEPDPMSPCFRLTRCTLTAPRYKAKRPARPPQNPPFRQLRASCPSDCRGSRSAGRSAESLNRPPAQTSGGPRAVPCCSCGSRWRSTCSKIVRSVAGSKGLSRRSFGRCSRNARDRGVSTMDDLRREASASNPASGEYLIGRDHCRTHEPETSTRSALSRTVARAVFDGLGQEPARLDRLSLVSAGPALCPLRRERDGDAFPFRDAVWSLATRPRNP
jgi:hypothetical protein